MAALREHEGTHRTPTGGPFPSQSAQPLPGTLFPIRCDAAVEFQGDITASGLRRAAASFCSVLVLCRFLRLPLHIAWAVRSSALQGHDVVDHVAGTAASRFAG